LRSPALFPFQPVTFLEGAEAEPQGNAGRFLEFQLALAEETEVTDIIFAAAADPKGWE
jgi:hypothetical protein